MHSTRYAFINSEGKSLHTIGGLQETLAATPAGETVEVYPNGLPAGGSVEEKDLIRSLLADPSVSLVRKTTIRNPYFVEPCTAVSTSYNGIEKPSPDAELRKLTAHAKPTPPKGFLRRLIVG